jgi:hypothetical protein
MVAEKFRLSTFTYVYIHIHTDVDKFTPTHPQKHKKPYTHTFSYSLRRDSGHTPLPQSFATDTPKSYSQAEILKNLKF